MLARPLHSQEFTSGFTGMSVGASIGWAPVGAQPPIVGYEDPSCMGTHIYVEPPPMGTHVHIDRPPVGTCAHVQPIPVGSNVQSACPAQDLDVTGRVSALPRR